jgi:ubiquinone/menaquinone biosynthesis C-methylase UbiE
MKQELQQQLMRVQALSYLSRNSRAWLALALFDYLDRLKRTNTYGSANEEFGPYIDRIISTAEIIEDLEWRSTEHFKPVLDGDLTTEAARIDYKVGQVYYNLWKDFDKREYFDRTSELLSERLEKNGISLSGFSKALDAGCGGGRYSAALKKAGIEQVTGLDISKNSIEFATNMCQDIGNLTFKQGSVLALPFADNTFDLVWSNGVLHHTESTLTGLKEIHRVLQPRGACWLYLYGGKNSFFWDLVDATRKLLIDVPQHSMMALMTGLGYTPGRIFHRCDFFYVPINRRYFEAEVREMVTEVGLKIERRLLRGVSNDWDEIMMEHPTIDPYIFGEGEMRFWLTKA